MRRGQGGKRWYENNSIRTPDASPGMEAFRAGCSATCVAGSDPFSTRTARSLAGVPKQAPVRGQSEGVDLAVSNLRTCSARARRSMGLVT
jgi:hypothetical protein